MNACANADTILTLQALQEVLLSSGYFFRKNKSKKMDKEYDRGYGSLGHVEEQKGSYDLIGGGCIN